MHWLVENLAGRTEIETARGIERDKRSRAFAVLEVTG